MTLNVIEQAVLDLDLGTFQFELSSCLPPPLPLARGWKQIQFQKRCVL
jgi:hypothetical protein